MGKGATDGSSAALRHFDDVGALQQRHGLVPTILAKRSRLPSYTSKYD
jgi:hypothetical protein